MFRRLRALLRGGRHVNNAANDPRGDESFDRLVAGVAGYAIFRLDAGGRVRTWNAGAEQIEGYHAEEIIGQHFSRFYTEEALQRGWPQSELEAAKRTGSFEEEGWRVRKDGSRFWASVVITTLYDDRNEVRGFLKITRDLTGKKQMEEALRQSEERFRLMIRNVKDHAIFMLDPAGRVSTWNEGAQKLNGYEAREVIGEHFSCLYPEDARRKGWPDEELRQAAARGVFEDDGWRERKDGSTYWANAVITPVRDERGTLLGFSKILRDLSERKKAEDRLAVSWNELEERVQARTHELTAANSSLTREIEQRTRAEADRSVLADQLRRRIDELAEADRQKNEFLAMLGHELRNPLAPMRNALHILKIAGADGATVASTRDMMERQLLHLVRLVDDLLDLSRIMRGKIELRREPVELVSVLGQAVEMSRPIIDAHGHELVMSAPAERLVLNGDPVRLAQTLNNLLTNAAKYTPQPGKIWLGTERRDGEVLIRVRDQGIGIAPELLPKVFNLFVQGESSLARSQGGLGIGLTLVRRLTELHGGSVEAQSDGPGKGCVFTIRLPVVVETDAPAPESATLAVTRLTRRRIVVVDDNVDAAETAATLLRLWGHDVRILHDGLAVLEVVREFQPNLLLLDIGLPGMTGYEVAKQLRAEPQFHSLVIAAMTGYGQPADQRRSREAGFNYHLVKPLDPGRLEAIFGAFN